MHSIRQSFSTWYPKLLGQKPQEFTFPGLIDAWACVYRIWKFYVYDDDINTNDRIEIATNLVRLDLSEDISKMSFNPFLVKLC